MATPRPARVLMLALVCALLAGIPADDQERCQILLDGNPHTYPKNITLTESLIHALSVHKAGTIHTVEPVRVPCSGFLRKGKIYLRSHATDGPVLGMIFDQHEFEFLAHAFGAAGPQRILDLGGNVGLASAYFASRFTGAKIATVEPSSGNAAMAVLNTMFSDRITILPGGIWHRPAMLYIHYASEGNEWAGQVRETNATQLATMAASDIIPAYTVDQIMRKMEWTHIDFAKIDVECTEQQLVGGQEPPAWLHKVTCATIEIHSFCGFDMQEMQAQIYKNFKTAGFDFTGVHGELHFFCKKKSGIPSAVQWALALTVPAAGLFWLAYTRSIRSGLSLAR
jgi:FkbM family methyltransferase